MSKRRAYPKSGYEYQNAPAQPQFGAVPNAPGYSVDQAAQGLQNMNLGGAPGVGVGVGAPGVAPIAQPNGAAPGYPQQQPVAQPQTHHSRYPQNVGYQMQGATGEPWYGADAAHGAPGLADVTGASNLGMPGMPGMPGMAQGAYGAATPTNQIYSTDLLKDLPPPIAELSAPPPPIVLPPNASVTQHPESNASYEYIRSSLNAVPTTNSLLKKTKLPFALVLRPYITLSDEDSKVPVVSDRIISRCRRCRSYINPFVTFDGNGRKWRCNMCNLLNDVPSGFDYDPTTGQTLNRYERSELNYGLVEFVAPHEYMARAPQPLVYIFVLDVGAEAVKSGLLATSARTILESLDRIPNSDGRTRVAFMGVDGSLHYFSIPLDKVAEQKKTEEGEEEAEEEDDDDEEEVEMLVVSDLEEPFLPVPDGLLVNLAQARNNIEKLLNNLNTMFAGNVDSKFALGPALKSAHKLIERLGGKIVVVACSLPNVGLGQLKIRDEESVVDKPKEASTLLTIGNSFYKQFAVECNKSQVTVDMFLASSSYQDIASLSNLPRYTSGQTHFYPAWTAEREEDVTKFSKELSSHLAMDLSLEAVLRVRGSSGLRMSAFYGNFFNRSSDLCSFPTFPRDQQYVIEVSIEEHIAKPTVAFQAAVLHTTSFGERRIRVLTVTLPTTQNISEVYASADQLAITSYYAHKAAEKVWSSSLQDARELLTKYITDLLATYKKELVAGNVGTSAPLQFSTNLRMLPLLLLSMQKHIALRAGRVPSDHRSAGLNLLTSAPIDRLVRSIYPTVYSLFDMPNEAGLPDEETGEIVMPEAMNATAASLLSYGLYLIDNSTELFLWVGGDAVSQLTSDVFGVGDVHQIVVGKTELPVLEDSEFNERIRNIIAKIRSNKSSIIWQNLYVVRGGSPSEQVNSANARELIALRMWAISSLVEDREANSASYREFLNMLRGKLTT